MNQLPESVIKKLEEERERLDRSFSRIWGLMSPSRERDEVMWHIMSAKRGITKILVTEIIKEEDDNEFI